MPTITVRFYCDYCKSTLAIPLTEDFCKDFKKRADKWPYPLVYPHKGHWALIFLDEDFKERGVNVSRISYEDK